MLGDLPTLAAAFLHEHRDTVAAIAILAAAIALAIGIDRTLLHRGHALATAVAREELTPVIDTRLRFLRRLVTLAILLVGALAALSQLGGLDSLAAGVLASGALLAAVLGFAARQTLANLIAGVMLTIAQPLRIGDSVTVEDESGTVEDVRLNYTIVRGADGRRIFIPNERLAAGVLRNDSILDPVIALEATLWLPRAVDADAALAALRGLEGASGAEIADVVPEGVRYTVARGAIAPAQRAAAAAQLRAEALRALRAAGLLDVA